MKNKKNLLNNRRFVLIGIILIAVLSFTLLIHALTVQDELNQLEQRSWLNQINLKCDDNLMLSNDNKILTL